MTEHADCLRTLNSASTSASERMVAARSAKENVIFEAVPVLIAVAGDVNTGDELAAECLDALERLAFAGAVSPTAVLDLSSAFLTDRSEGLLTRWVKLVSTIARLTQNDNAFAELVRLTRTPGAVGLVALDELAAIDGPAVGSTLNTLGHDPSHPHNAVLPDRIRQQSLTTALQMCSTARDANILVDDWTLRTLVAAGKFRAVYNLLEAGLISRDGQAVLQHVVDRTDLSKNERKYLAKVRQKLALLMPPRSNRAGGGA